MKITFGFCFLFYFASAHAGEEDCGALKNHYGPKDYRLEGKEGRALVENIHFTPKVESLRGGNTSITAGGDLNYTLRVFPNHPRGLMTVIRLAEKEKRAQPQGMDYPVWCWFDRAERFRPDDGMVQMLYGTYLIKAKRPEEALSKLERARELDGDNGNLLYNLGLAYFDLKKYDRALESAHQAYALGFSLPGLKDKLQRAGFWRDPAPLPAKADFSEGSQQK